MPITKGPITGILENPVGFLLILLAIFLILFARKSMVDYGGNVGKTLLKVGDFIATIRFLGFILVFTILFIMMRR